MTHRDHAPVGAPCWAGLSTRDVEASQAFYRALLGWEAGEASPEFGGYFMFLSNGVPAAGGSPALGEGSGSDAWGVSLCVTDTGATIDEATKRGARVLVPEMRVADLGTMCAFSDNTGATIGGWQPGTFEGFTTMGEPGSPGFFELSSSDFPASLEFYAAVFHWEVRIMSDTDDFRYATMHDDSSGLELAGVHDASKTLPKGSPSTWTVYWTVEDTDATLERASTLGGSVTMEAADSPYGRLAGLSDPGGAAFKVVERRS